MKKKKFIFVKLEIRNGEYEYTSTSAHEIGSRKSTEVFGRKYAETFYGSSIKPYQDGAWTYFNGGEVAVRCTTAVEITKEEYQTLNKFNFMN